MKSCQPIAIGLSLSVFSAALFAEAEYESDPVVVTASRTKQHVSESLASVTVIDRQEIERLQPESIMELLRGRNGIAFANNGGPGKTTSLFLRGTNSEHVLVLIDGVRAGSATTGSFAFQDIPVQQIERIEIVRGPYSSLYGSEAIGGVIHIFTRKGRSGFHPSAALSVGSNQRVEATTGISGGNERGWYSINVARTQTNGINTCATEGVNIRCQSLAPAERLDDDAYENNSINLRGGYELSDKAELDFSWFKATGDSEFDGSSFSGNVSEFSQSVLSGGLTIEATDFWTIDLHGGRTRDESDTFFNQTFNSRFNTERDSATFQNDFALGYRQKLSLGLDYFVDKVESSTGFTQTERDNLGYFAQYQGVYGPHIYRGSIRVDDNEQFGTHTTGSVSYGFELTDAITAMASYGTAFNAPSFNDLFFPSMFGFSGNPNLDPEKSESYEIGLSGNHGRMGWAINAYQTDVENLIENVFSGGLLSPTNIGEARIRGVELNGRMDIGQWHVDAQMEFLEPEVRGSGANAGNVLPRRHQQAFRLNVDRSITNKARLGASFIAVGERYDRVDNSVELPGYGLVDLRASYSLDPDWTLQAKLSNVFDKQYQTVLDYNQPGREFLLTVRYQPK